MQNKVYDINSRSQQPNGLFKQLVMPQKQIDAVQLDQGWSPPGFISAPIVIELNAEKFSIGSIWSFPKHTINIPDS